MNRRAQIRALLEEARLAGDEEMASIAQRALDNGVGPDWYECVRVIDDVHNRDEERYS